jgi:hypothetical protein
MTSRAEAAVAAALDGTGALLAERKTTHGEFRDHARVTQRLKDVIRDELGEVDKTLDPIAAEALDMIVHKIGRILAGNPAFKDHWVDIAGYATLVAERVPG